MKKRKASDTIIISSNTQLVPPSSTPTTVSVPITITRTKDDHQQVDELINIKLEPFEELLTSSTQLRSSADITVQEILDWAKTFKIPQSAVNELLQILKIKRIKTEIKSESTTAKPSDGAASSSLQQRKSRFYFLAFLISPQWLSFSLEYSQLKSLSLFLIYYLTLLKHIWRLSRWLLFLLDYLLYDKFNVFFIRNCRSLFKNLSTFGRHGAQSDESNDNTRTESRLKECTAIEDSEHKPGITQMRFNPAGNNPKARADAASLQDCQEGLRKSTQSQYFVTSYIFLQKNHLENKIVRIFMWESFFFRDSCKWCQSSYWKFFISVNVIENPFKSSCLKWKV